MAQDKKKTSKASASAKKTLSPKSASQVKGGAMSKFKELK
jgi:hypothetical protein